MLVANRRIRLKNGRALLLRSPRASEARSTLEYLRQLFHESYENMNHPSQFWDSFPEEKEAQTLEDFERAPTRFMISAFESDESALRERMIGNIGIFPADKEFTRHSARLGMGILREFCRQGLGTALMSYALETAREAGLTRIELSVRTSNTAGIALYEKTGFERVGLLKHAARIEGTYRDEYLYQILL